MTAAHQKNQGKKGEKTIQRSRGVEGEQQSQGGGLREQLLTLSAVVRTTIFATALIVMLKGPFPVSIGRLSISPAAVSPLTFAFTFASSTFVVVPERV